MKQLVNSYLVELSARGCSEVTLLDYRTKLRKFVVYVNSQIFPGFTVDMINHDILFDYVAWLRRSNVNSISVQSYVRSLRAFLNWLYVSGVVEEDYCSRFRLPKARKSYIDILTDDEISIVYSCYSDPDNIIHLRNRCILDLMLDCGSRLNEVVTAERRHLHLNDGYLIVTGKGNKQRSVSFGSLTKIDLTRYLLHAKYSKNLFTNSDGSALTADTIKNMFRKLKRKTGIERLHPHLLRHTFATRFLENGGDIYDLKDLLGHTSLKQVQVYLHLSKTRILDNYERFSPLDNVKKPLLVI